MNKYRNQDVYKYLKLYRRMMYPRLLFVLDCQVELQNGYRSGTVVQIVVCTVIYMTCCFQHKSSLTTSNRVQFSLVDKLRIRSQDLHSEKDGSKLLKYHMLYFGWLCFVPVNNTLYKEKKQRDKI